MEKKDREPDAVASLFINNTSRHLFLTGKAGTGKTTFLKYIVANTHKKCIVTAPTGIAAINAGGVTLHSLFQLPFGAFIPDHAANTYTPGTVKINNSYSLLKDLQLNNNKRQLLRELELLIIDEVSMLRADLLDAIDLILKQVRKNSGKAFGGVQVLFIGDLLQLPPVVKEEEWRVLNKYYHSIYFFDAQVLKDQPPVYIELEKIYRQTDNQFISLLNKLRNNATTQADIDFLNSFYKPAFKPKPEENYIFLTTHNAKAERINKDYLQNLNARSFYYKAKVNGDFNESAYPVASNLELKVGAQVMFVKNDPTGAKRFFNGKIAVVDALNDKEITVSFNDAVKPLVVELYEWQNMRYALNESGSEIVEQVAGTFEQFPLKLAWAITVHKSQGLTFDKAILDIDAAFAPGQAYVALSRLRSLNGLVLSDRINSKAIETDEQVKLFSGSRSSAEQHSENIARAQAKYLQEMIQKSFSFTAIEETFLEFKISFTTSKKKAVKEGHKTWAVELVRKITEAKSNADKFLHQVNHILQAPEENYTYLNERIRAANVYFENILNVLSDDILRKIKEIKMVKRVKTLINELLDLEASCYAKLIELDKPLVFMNLILNKLEFTKKDLKENAKQNAREEKLRACLEIEEGDIKSKARSQKLKGKMPDEEEDSVKQTKSSSKEESYSLFKEGMDLATIAKIRGMTVGTIESHLVPYVATGQLDSRKFVDSERAEQIIAQAKALKTFKLGAIKEALKEEFTYSEIKFAIAGYLSQSGTA